MGFFDGLQNQGYMLNAWAPQPPPAGGAPAGTGLAGLMNMAGMYNPYPQGQGLYNANDGAPQMRAAPIRQQPPPMRQAAPPPGPPPMRAAPQPQMTGQWAGGFGSGTGLLGRFGTNWEQQNQGASNPNGQWNWFSQQTTPGQWQQTDTGTWRRG